jgi:hypothetical protein
MSLLEKVARLEFGFLFHRRKSKSGFDSWCKVTRFYGTSRRKLKRIWNAYVYWANYLELAYLIKQSTVSNLWTPVCNVD